MIVQVRPLLYIRDSHKFCFRLVDDGYTYLNMLMISGYYAERYNTILEG